MASARFVEVAVPLPVFETYFYGLPAPLEAQAGVRVLVPLGGRTVTGVVLSVRDALPLRARRPARSVSQVLDEAPVLPAILMDVVLRAGDELLCPPGVALMAAIPPGTAPRPGRRVVLLDAGRKALETGQARGTLGKVLWSLGRGALPESRLRTRFPRVAGELQRLERIGWIQRELATEPPRVRPRLERVYRAADGLDLEAWRVRLGRAKRQLALLEELVAAGEPLALPAGDSLRALVRAGAVVREQREVSRATHPAPLRPPEEMPQPTPHQREAIAAIADAIAGRRDRTFLLHGVTGSGKTEVYLRASEQALARGRGVIVLVPEISLTHQVVDRFRARFGDQVAVLHSGLSGGERFDQWRHLRDGVQPIVIGARSAVFAPLGDPGLIVIDEEQDGAYKSDEGFRYHARDVAQLRARAHGCPLVLGGATPDVATAYRAERGEIERLELPRRVASRPLPEVEIVDMGQERRRGGRLALLSSTLRRALNETLVAGKQAILFVNRRGFATFVYCFHCGHALRCKHCDIALVYHASEGALRPHSPAQGELRCHYCGYREDPSETCPACLSREGGMFGFGTERLQEEVAAMFPHARVGRLDRDTSARKGAQHQILRAFHRGETDVLVGTQLVAKGHDVPGVTLVGVVAADLGLHFPDFRASERTFQLLTQVAGRAGRGDDPGKVILQTFLPNHYAIALARTHDYPTFYREELRRRRPHGYPPFRELFQLALSGLDGEAVEAAAFDLARLAKSVPGSDRLEVLGPAPAPLAKIRDRFRWQFLLLGDRDSLRSAGRELLAQARGRHRGVAVRLVPSPVQML